MQKASHLGFFSKLNNILGKHSKCSISICSIDLIRTWPFLISSANIYRMSIRREAWEWQSPWDLMYIVVTPRRGQTPDLDLGLPSTQLVSLFGETDLSSQAHTPRSTSHGSKKELAVTMHTHSWTSVWRITHSFIVHLSIRQISFKC